MRVQRGSDALEVAYYPIVRYVLPTGGPMRTISIKLPEELDRALTELAKRCNASRSALLRQALEAFTKRQVRSVLEAAGDLAGSLDGPKDLSSAFKHMKGYGE